MATLKPKNFLYYNSLLIFIFMLSVTACEPTLRHHPSELLATSFNTKVHDAKTAFSNKEYQKAEELYRQLISTDNNNIEHHFFLAESYRLQAKHPQALTEYKTALNRANTEMRLRINEGMALSYLEQGQADAAIELLGRIIKEDATRWRTMNALGVAYALEGNAKEALEYFNLSETLHPNSPVTLNNAGLALIIANDTTNGIAQLKKAKALLKPSHPFYKRIINNLAMGYVFLGDNDKAEAILLKQFSTSATYNNLGYFSLLKENTSLAKEYLTKSLHHSPVFYERASKNLTAITP